MSTENISPRIYVACLAAYNNGTLHGTWIDATQGADYIRDEINNLLADSPVEGAEEYAIHDYDGFEGIRISEYDAIDDVAKHAQMLDEHGQAWAAYCNYAGEDYATEAGFEESYRGKWRSEVEFAEQLVDDMGELNSDSMLARYFDYEAFARDLFLNDYYFINGYVFDRNV